MIRCHLSHDNHVLRKCLFDNRMGYINSSTCIKISFCLWQVKTKVIFAIERHRDTYMGVCTYNASCMMVTKWFKFTSVSVHMFIYIVNEDNAWASYQIRKIAGCACAGNAGNVFPRHRLQRKPLVSDPGMHHGTCVTHVPWCMSGSLTRGGGENVPGIPGACALAILRIWQEAHCRSKRHGCIGQTTFGNLQAV